MASDRDANTALGRSLINENNPEPIERIEWSDAERCWTLHCKSASGESYTVKVPVSRGNAR